MTSANALAGGWTAVWRVDSPTFAATVVANSHVATCGATTLTGGTLAYESDHKHIKYTLPNTNTGASNNKVTGVPTGNTLARATYQPICAGGKKLTVTINSWTPSTLGTATAVTTGHCLVVMNSGHQASTDVK